MASKLNVRVLDYNSEQSSMGVSAVTMDAANFVAQTALHQALVSALEDMIIGVVANVQVIALDTAVSAVPPSDPFAQRETKWLVTYADSSTNKRYTAEIPCADLSLLSNNSDDLDLAGTEAAAFVSAFEDYVRSPAGNAVTVVKITHIGRNL